MEIKFTTAMEPQYLIHELALTSLPACLINLRKVSSQLQFPRSVRERNTLSISRVHDFVHVASISVVLSKHRWYQCQHFPRLRKPVRLITKTKACNNLLILEATTRKFGTNQQPKPFIDYSMVCGLKIVWQRATSTFNFHATFLCSLLLNFGNLCVSRSWHGFNWLSVTTHRLKFKSTPVLRTKEKRR